MFDEFRERFRVRVIVKILLKWFLLEFIFIIIALEFFSIYIVSLVDSSGE